MNQELWNKVKNADLLKQVSEGKEVIWINENLEKTADALAKIDITMADMPVLHRLLKKYFPKQSQQTA